MPQQLLTFREDNAIECIIDFPQVTACWHVLHWYSDLTANPSFFNTTENWTCTIVIAPFISMLGTRIKDSYHKAALMNLVTSNSEDFTVVANLTNTLNALNKDYSIIFACITTEEFNSDECKHLIETIESRQAKVMFLVYDPNSLPT